VLQPICALTGIIYNVLFRSTREAAAFVANKPFDCCVTLACNFELHQAEWPLLASNKKYSFGLAAIQLALRLCPLTVISLWPCGRAPSQQYSFDLAAVLPHGKIPSALRPCPLKVIFLWPCGCIPSWQYSFGLAAAPLTALFLRPCSCASTRRFTPHGGNQFSLCLMAIIDFIPPTQ
jgi:hypothetical protein